MALILPRSQYPAFATFVRLTPEQRETLRTALENITPTLDTDKVSQGLARDLRLPATRATALVQMLQSMYTVRLERKMSAQDFAQQMCDFAASSPAKDLKPADNNWEPVKQSLASVLNLDATLGVTAKAWGVKMESERIFEGGRIITDIRPIFGPNLAEKPTAAVIVHTLRIKYFDVESSKEFYVVLDSAEVKELKETMERALEKEANLRRLLKDQLLCLEAGE